MLQNYILWGTLGIYCIEDIRKKQITVSLAILSAIAAVIMHLCYQTESIYSMLAGALVGSLILIVSKITNGKIGMGDGVVFMLTGFYLGAEKNLELMFLSFCLAGIWAWIKVFLFHKGKEELPFLPFLFLAYGILQCI